MRQGSNPLRSAKVDGYKACIAAAITHLPNEDGYHASRFEVIKTSLFTMRERAGVDVGVFVFDNGSSQKFRDWLTKVYKPDHLVLSTNVGKASARAMILRGLPPLTMVSIADDDMYYYPDWFRKELSIYNHFPNVGQVSGYPVRTQFRWGNKRTLEWAKKNGKLESKKFIPPQWDMDFCSSIGRDYLYQLSYTQNDNDHRVKYNDRYAYCVAHHCQFICEAGKLAPFALWDHDAMGDERKFDIAVDEAGLLRLTTCERLTRHIGNVLDPEMKLA